MEAIRWIGDWKLDDHPTDHNSMLLDQDFGVQLTDGRKIICRARAVPVNGASFPWFVSPLLGGTPWRGPWKYGSTIHDYAYALGIDRKFADNLFLACLKLEGCPRWKCHAMYYGVRFGGWVPYKRMQKSRVGNGYPVG